MLASGKKQIRRAASGLIQLPALLLCGPGDDKRSIFDLGEWGGGLLDFGYAAGQDGRFFAVSMRRFVLGGDYVSEIVIQVGRHHAILAPEAGAGSRVRGGLEPHTADFPESQFEVNIFNPK